MRQHRPPRVNRRNRRISRQRQPQRLHHAGHRRCRPHGHAVAGRPAHTAFGVHELAFRHQAGLHRLAESPNNRPRADGLAAVAPVQHGAAAQHNRGYIAAGRPHHQARRRLVTPAHQHNAVDGVGADRFLHIHADQIAKHRRRRPHIRLAHRRNGELQRKPARFPDSVFHPLRQLAKVRIARRQLAPCIADPDHRPPVKHVPGKPLVPHPAPVNKPVLIVSAKPGLRPQFPFVHGCHYTTCPVLPLPFRALP